ncbi:MAG: hypothetical protein Q4E69_02345 [Bacilli bacterium]|nr:hypothetical protein [Bacilli bacterium]
MEEEKVKSGKGKYIAIIIILCLLVCGLGGFIVYDKVLSPASKNTEKVEDTNKEEKESKEEETETEKPVDLSNVPVVDSACTFEYTMSGYNSYEDKYRFKDESACLAKYKYVITDAVVDGKKVDVQVISGEVGDQINSKNVELYINGVKVESRESINGIGLKYIGVHDNMLFTHLDGGSYVTGYTQILAFDKSGNVKYNLGKDQSVVATNIISRPSVKILDGTITFSTHVDTSPIPTNTSYAITFANGVFSEPTIVG